MAHIKAQKDKVRKSGLSLENKTRELGRYCDVFSALVYWNPTRERMETAMHVPRGQRVPDLNRIVRLHVPVTVPASVPSSVTNSHSFDNQPRAMRDRATAERHDRAAKSKPSISRPRRTPATTRMPLLA